jgi:hypothetical protein
MYKLGQLRVMEEYCMKFISTAWCERVIFNMSYNPFAPSPQFDLNDV